MGKKVTKKTDYGNWVSFRIVFVPLVFSLLFGGFSFLLPALGIVAFLLFLCFLYFAYARYLFSPNGGNLQIRVQDLVLDHIEGWDGKGKVLDIGCGNGLLTIRIAKNNPRAEVIGIDYWGKSWDYSKEVCDRNAEIEGVVDRAEFRRANAASLPFDDGAFDLVISNLVFHEVRDVKDKKKLIKEALRVLKSGGYFVFQDLFLWKLVYGETGALLETIRGWGIEKVEFFDTSSSSFIPRILKIPFMLGAVAILYGKK